MTKSSADEKILSYNDVVLRRSDLGILSGPRFLNDRIIEFYFSYISSIYPSDDALLVPPSIAFWISNCPDVDSLKDFLQPLKLPDKKLVLFPVNNNEDVSIAEGGSHWSLLVYERNANVFVHHDSLSGLNKTHALQLYEVVARYLSSSEATAHAKYVELTDSPQQQNGSDCGLYLLQLREPYAHGMTAVITKIRDSCGVLLYKSRLLRVLLLQCEQRFSLSLKV